MFRRPPRATRTDLFPYTTLFRSDAAFAIWSAKVRYLGVGAMLVGGIWTLFSLRKSLLSGIRSGIAAARKGSGERSEEHTSELQSLMRISYAVFCLKKKKKTTPIESTR